MRIISGKYKGRRLSPPKNLPVRPTTDMAKESLFNIINNIYYWEGLSVLDLFSGTGNIAIEFASRGVEQITVVDRNASCIKYISSINQEFDANFNIHKMDVYKFLQTAVGPYKLIFADPPYDFEQEKFETIINQVFDNNLLMKEGVLVVEHSKHTELDKHAFFKFDKRYGGNVFSFFAYEDL